MTYDVFPDELRDIFVFDTGISFCLHPLTEVVGCNEQKLLLGYSSGQGADNVHPSLRKKPRTCDRVEGFRRYMGNGSVSLTLIASSNIDFNDGGPIIFLCVGVMCQSSSH